MTVGNFFVNNFKDKILRYIHKSIYKPGHYYSAVPDPLEIKRREKQIFDTSKSLTGIELNEQEQFILLKNGLPVLSEFPYKKETNTRYKLPNNFFGRGDVLSLF